MIFVFVKFNSFLTKIYVFYRFIFKSILILAVPNNHEINLLMKNITNHLRSVLELVNTILFLFKKVFLLL